LHRANNLHVHVRDLGVLARRREVVKTCRWYKHPEPAVEVRRAVRLGRKAEGFAALHFVNVHLHKAVVKTAS
jgi:hypothetical protein